MIVSVRETGPSAENPIAQQPGVLWFLEPVCRLWTVIVMVGSSSSSQQQGIVWPLVDDAAAHGLEEGASPSGGSAAFAVDPWQLWIQVKATLHVIIITITEPLLPHPLKVRPARGQRLQGVRKVAKEPAGVFRIEHAPRSDDGCCCCCCWGGMVGDVHSIIRTFTGGRSVMACRQDARLDLPRSKEVGGSVLRHHKEK